MPRERKYTVQDDGYCYEIKEIKTELREVVAKLKQTADRMVYIESTGVKTRPVARFSSREKRIENVAQTRSGLMEVDMKIRLCCLADVIKMDPQ